jgi:peroxiredoxin
MKTTVCLLILIALAAPAGMAQLRGNAGPDTSPAVGTDAPDFAMPRGSAASSLSDYRGQKKVLLMFFPGAFTPGCTTEFTEAGVYYDRFVDMNIELIGISRDLQGALNAFRESVGARNAFLSDPDMNVIRAYGAESPRGAASRFYFLIDESGKIVWKSTNNSLIPTEVLLEDLAKL